jgi:hypothetical protein
VINAADEANKRVSLTWLTLYFVHGTCTLFFILILNETVHVVQIHFVIILTAADASLTTPKVGNTFIQSI